MPYTYILDDSIKLSPTLILTADHSTLLFLPCFFYQIKNFLFLLWVNLYMITGIYLHDPSPFNGPFFMTPPFSESQKVVTLPLFPTPSPLLISDKFLTVDFAKEEEYIVIKQLVTVHCSSLHFEPVSTITWYKSLFKCCTLCDIRTETWLLLVCQ